MIRARSVDTPSEPSYALSMVVITGRDEGEVNGRRVVRANGRWTYVDFDEMFNDDASVGWLTARKLEREHAAKYGDLAEARLLR